MPSRDKSQSKKGIHLSGDNCVICGWNKKDYKGNSLVVGSHVRGFRNQMDYDNFDNIIALCPNHHIEFDRGNISIDPIKKICIHINKNDEGHGKKIIGKIDHIQKGYFYYHTNNIFKYK